MQEVSPISAGKPVEVIGSKPGLVKPGKSVKKFVETVKVAGKIGSTSRMIVSAIDSIKKVSCNLVKISKLSKLTNILLSPLAILGIYEVGVKIVKEAETKQPTIKAKHLSKAEQKERAAARKQNIVERVKAVAKLVTHVDSVVDSVASACSLVYLFKPAMGKIVEWIPIYTIISFFVGLFSIYEAGESTVKGGKLVFDLKKVLAEVDDPKKSDQEKARILEAYLAKFQEKDIKPLFKKLAISGKAVTETGVRVRDRIEFLVRNRLRFQTKDVAETTEMLRVLKNRAEGQLAFDILDLANRIVSCVGKIFLVFVPPLAPVGFIILATTGLVSLVMMGGRYLFATKNPFQTSSETRASHIIGCMSNAISHLRERLKNVFETPLPAPATV